LWAGNPDVAIAHRFAGSRILNCGGHRPYIEAKAPTQWTWKPYRPTPARVVLTAEEIAFARPYAGKIVIEPNVKLGTGHSNKQWPHARYQAIADLYPGRMLQFGLMRPLAGVEHVVTPSIRHAAAILAVATAYIGPEGGLHHLAAALDTPAVVIFGGFIAPEHTGYDSQHNIFTGKRACGLRVDCPHCRAAMDAITVDRVVEGLLGVINARSRRLDVSRRGAAHAGVDDHAGQSVAAERPLDLPGQEAGAGPAAVPA
jgi:hypothetical protein